MKKAQIKELKKQHAFWGQLLKSWDNMLKRADKEKNYGYALSLKIKIDMLQSCYEDIGNILNEKQ